MTNYTTQSKSNPALPKPKVDPDTYDPLTCKEFCNPNLIIWEMRQGLCRNATDAVVRYVYWHLVLASTHGRDFKMSEKTVAQKLGISVDAVRSAVRRTDWFHREGVVGQRARRWVLGEGNGKGKGKGTEMAGRRSQKSAPESPPDGQSEEVMVTCHHSGETGLGDRSNRSGYPIQQVTVTESMRHGDPSHKNEVSEGTKRKKSLVVEPTDTTSFPFGFEKESHEMASEDYQEDGYGEPLDDSVDESFNGSSDNYFDDPDDTDDPVGSDEDNPISFDGYPDEPAEETPAAVPLPCCGSSNGSSNGYSSGTPRGTSRCTPNRSLDGSSTHPRVPSQPVEEPPSSAPQSAPQSASPTSGTPPIAVQALVVYRRLAAEAIKQVPREAKPTLWNLTEKDSDLMLPLVEDCAILDLSLIDCVAELAPAWIDNQIQLAVASNQPVRDCLRTSAFADWLKGRLPELAEEVALEKQAARDAEEKAVRKEREKLGMLMDLQGAFRKGFPMEKVNLRCRVYGIPITAQYIASQTSKDEAIKHVTCAMDHAAKESIHELEGIIESSMAFDSMTSGLVLDDWRTRFAKHMVRAGTLNAKTISDLMRLQAEVCIKHMKELPNAPR